MTGVYLKDVTNAFWPVLHLNACHMGIFSSCWLCRIDQQTPPPADQSIKTSSSADSAVHGMNDWRPFVYGGLASITAECGKHWTYYSSDSCAHYMLILKIRKYERMQTSFSVC